QPLAALYPLSLHDALPICYRRGGRRCPFSGTSFIGESADQCTKLHHHTAYRLGYTRSKSAADGHRRGESEGVLEGGTEKCRYVKDRKSTRLNSSHVKISYA